MGGEGVRLGGSPLLTTQPYPAVPAPKLGRGFQSADFNPFSLYFREREKERDPQQVTFLCTLPNNVIFSHCNLQMN